MNIISKFYILFRIYYYRQMPRIDNLFGYKTVAINNNIIPFVENKTAVTLEQSIVTVAWTTQHIQYRYININ